MAGDSSSGGGRGRPAAQRPEDLSDLVVERLNAGDVDGLVELYEPDAVLALPGGGTAVGAGQIREAYARLVAGRPTFSRGEQLPTLRRGDLALMASRLPGGVVTVEVARQRQDGTWRWVLDQPDLGGWRAERVAGEG